MRQFTQEDLAAYDGREGRPVYVAHGGKVYDVSESKLWRNGLHMRRHQAGRDLSAELSAAPHGPERLEAFPQVGILGPAAGPEELRGSLERLLARFPYLRRHPHPMTVHFPLVFAIAAPVFAILRQLTHVASFGTTSYHCLWGLCLSAPVGVVTGYFTWRVNYQRRPMRQVRLKQWLGAALWILSVALVAWPGATAYPVHLVLTCALAPIAAALGWYGSQLTFPVE